MCASAETLISIKYKRSNMRKKDKKKTGANELEYRQMCLMVDGDYAPIVVAKPLKMKSHPANLVPVPGCVVEVHKDITEDDAFLIASEITKLAEGGQLLLCGGVQSHLSCAWSILRDLVKDAEGDCSFSPETVAALLRGAMFHVVSAGKEIRFDCERDKPER